MLGKFLELIRFIAPAAVLAITLYFLLFGGGRYGVLYEVVIVAIALVALAVISVAIFRGQRVRNNDPASRTSQYGRPSRIGLAVGLVLLFIAAPVWIVVATNQQQDAELIFGPFIGFAAVGAILVAYNWYLWMSNR